MEYCGDVRLICWVLYRGLGGVLVDGVSWWGWFCNVGWKGLVVTVGTSIVWSVCHEGRKHNVPFTQMLERNTISLTTTMSWSRT